MRCTLLSSFIKNLSLCSNLVYRIVVVDSGFTLGSGEIMGITMVDDVVA